MKVRTVGFFFKQAFLSLCRNKWMSAAAIATVAICLFIVGIFTLLVLNANYIAGHLESNVEIVAFMERDATRTEVLSVAQQIQNISGVAQVKLVPKEEGLARLNQRFGQEHNLLSALGGSNPLPDYYEVKVKSPEDIKKAAQTLEQITYVQKVKYGQGAIEKLFKVIHWVRLIGLGVVLLLSVGSIFLISTTIRLTVFARRKEINIMKYVGATDWFIRWPFFLEGMALGFIGALLAIGVLYLTYDLLISNLRYSISFIPLIMDPGIIFKIVASLLAIGTLVGALGSLISVRRFLQV
ncbi:permease-like cell division protein FtsX [Bacillota bacterium LX-D]|nr:permease-like cell division protein FtsX [Bacillota bacterium LX-D]